MSAQQKFGLYFAVLAIAFATVFVIDSITPDYEVQSFTGETDEMLIFQGDQSDYVKLAEDGGISDGDVLGPFAYRMIPAMIAAWFSKIFDVHVVYGYQLMTFIGLGLQLFMVFVLAREVGTNIWQSFFVMLIVALSLANVRFMNYDFIRPDAVALPWMLGVTYLIVRGQLRLAMLLCWVGLLAREFFLVLSGIISLYYFWQAYQIYRDEKATDTIWQPIGFAFLSTIGAIAVFMIPRLLIDVPVTYQFIETTGQDTLWEGLLFIFGSVGRNKNYIMSFVGYMFPSILLFSFLRLPRYKSDLQRLGVLIVLYSLGILFLSYIGGLDFLRFSAYMVIPQVLILAIIIKNEVLFWELIVVVIFWGWYNRIYQSFPPLQENFNEYLLFISPWGMDVPKVISDRFELAVGLILVLWLGRAFWIGTRNWRDHHSLFDIQA